MSEPDYVVLRAAPGAPDWFLPPRWDGRWIDRTALPPPPPDDWTPPDDGTYAEATFVPTGRFEVRDYDGAVAEVFEAQPPVRPGEEPTT
jgi:hypothetical protein